MKKNKKLLLNTLLPIITPIPALVGSFYLISGNFNFNKLNSELEFKNPIRENSWTRKISVCWLAIQKSTP